jgi:manganese/zinc/iron transport system substrate-binding protein
VASSVASSDAASAVTRASSGDAATVVVTTSIGADLIRQVCSDAEGVRVRALMGPGVDPHLYRPTVRDVRALADAGIVVAHGLHLEGRMEDILPKLERRGTAVIRLCDGADARDDPHTWMDARMWADAAERAGERLAQALPESAAEIRRGAARTAARWRALDTSVREAVATIPHSKRMLVTAHDAFGHFGRAYGIDVRGIQGISTESEAGLADMRALVDEIVARGIPAVFHETSVPDRAVEALVESSASRGHALRNAAALHSDALGPPGSGADTYDGMMRSNVKAIVEALGGNASALERRE